MDTAPPRAGAATDARQDAASFAFTGKALVRAVHLVRRPAYVVADPDGRLGVGFAPPDGGGLRHVATMPPLYPEWLGDRSFAYPEWLGDRSFALAHATRFPYIAGAMANGIATTELVIAMARSGMLGFFGAAGLGLDRVEAAAATLADALDRDRLSWGMNLIHSPNLTAPST